MKENGEETRLARMRIVQKDPGRVDEKNRTRRKGVLRNCEMTEG